MGEVLHKAVTSSTIRCCGYDTERKTLKVTFHTGAEYAYCGVEAPAYHALVGAESVGKHFHRQVKPVYEGKRV